MADLTITIGPVTSTVTASNANAQAVLTKYIGAYYGPTDGTAQEQLDWVVAKLRTHIVEVAQDHNRALKMADAVAEAEANNPSWAA